MAVLRAAISCWPRRSAGQQPKETPVESRCSSARRCRSGSWRPLQVSDGRRKYSNAWEEGAVSVEREWVVVNEMKRGKARSKKQGFIGAVPHGKACDSGVLGCC
jgi:hypothetical protein